MDDALYRLHAEREETYWWWVAKNRIILSLVDRFLPAPGQAPSAHPGTNGSAHKPSALPRALDIGCGAGGVLARLAHPAGRFDAVGIDLSPIAREYCANRGLTALDGSLPDGLPFTAPDSFSLVILSEVVEHVAQDRESVAAVVRLLMPGGILICTVPAHQWLWSSHDEFNHHHRRYTRAGFGALFDGLPVERLVLSYYQAASMPLVAGVRGLQKVQAAITGRRPHTPEVRPLPGPVNTLLRQTFEIEKLWLPHARLPWGTSVISVHRKLPQG